MKNKIKLRYLFILELIFCTLLLSQASNLDRLGTLKQEIAQHKRKAANLERQEASELDVLDNLDRQLYLTQKLVLELKKEEEANRKKARKAQAKFDTTTAEHNRLKRLIAKRAVHFYKRGHFQDLEILLTAGSINKAYLWLKYQKILTENDARNLENIKRKQIAISRQKDELEKIYADRQNILSDKQAENDGLVTSRKKRKSIVKRIKKNRRVLLLQIEEYERSARDIKRLINEEEQRRVSHQFEIEIPQHSNFPDLKRKMLWPVHGRITRKFGKNKHPKLKTITQNLGIDIQAAYGTPVRATANGIVSRITWIRGLGNIIMLNHFEGYYTVYAHLGDILVSNGETITAGQVIANIGESGIAEVPALHFEIWENNKAVNPKKWLR